MVESGEFQKQAHQPDTARSDQRHHQMGGQDQPMQKSHPDRRLEESHQGGIRIDAFFPLEPVLSAVEGCRVLRGMPRSSAHWR